MVIVRHRGEGIVVMALKEVDIKGLSFNPCVDIEENWMLITAGDGSRHNAMTANWGGVGVLWGSPVATVYIRQSRYTKEFVDANEKFTIGFYDPEKYFEQLAYLGRVSGRDEDKLAAVGFHAVPVDGTTTFEEAHLTLVCRKAYAKFLDADGFVPGSADDAKWYSDHDYHTMYIAKIEHAYVNE